MHVIIDGGVQTHVRESALKVDSARKIPCSIGESNLRQRRASPVLYQLSYITTQACASWHIWISWNIKNRIFLAFRYSTSSVLVHTSCKKSDVIMYAMFDRELRGHYSVCQKSYPHREETLCSLGPKSSPGIRFWQQGYFADVDFSLESIVSGLWLSFSFREFELYAGRHSVYVSSSSSVSFFK